jgi:hypothetical protein
VCDEKGEIISSCVFKDEVSLATTSKCGKYVGLEVSLHGNLARHFCFHKSEKYICKEQIRVKYFSEYMGFCKKLLKNFIFPVKCGI